MASTAKVASKKVRTYASAVAGVTEKSIFSSLAKCTLRSPPNMPHARIPNTDEKHSFFIDLKSTDASEEEVLAAITLDGIVGVHSRDDLWVVEFMCKNDAVVEAAIKTPFLIKDRKPVEAIWPRHKTNKHVVIKVANVPILSYAELIERIHHQWKQYGTVIDARPYTFPGKPWLTKRWDVLLQLPEGVNKLDASPVFQFDGYTDVMVCSWPGAKKACLRCKIAGHSTSKCPAQKPKNQKVGELANPLQKIGGVGQDQKRKNKGSEVLPGNTEKTEASTSASASATKSATLASPATVATSISAPSGHFTVAAPLATPDPPTDTSALPPATFLGSELQQSRPTTPTTSSTLVKDPDTPKKGNKRGAKDDEQWTPTVEDVQRYVSTHNICTICCQRGHNELSCPRRKKARPIPLPTLPRTENFRSEMELWANSRRKRGKSWRFYDMDTRRPFDTPICTRCGNGGHLVAECSTTPKCNHCGKDHLGINCPTRPRYAYEAMED